MIIRLGEWSLDKIFKIEICYRNMAVDLWLPATDYQLLDAIDKLGFTQAVKPTIDIYQYGDGFQNLSEVMEKDGLDLFELNALARRLSQFELEDMIALHALVFTRLEREESNIPIRELLDLAYSTDCCEVHPGVDTYKELGHFYVENGMLPELKDVPEAALPFLNYEEIGRKISMEECGMLAPGGYVTQTSDLLEVSKSMEFAPPPNPDYTILLEISKGHPTNDNEKTALLSLPAEPAAMDAALTAVGAWDWMEAGIRCLDCRVPSLIPHIGGDDNVAHINCLAQVIQEMNDKEVRKFKAVLEAVEELSVLGATQIADVLDEYLYSPQLIYPEDLASDFLASSMGERALDTLSGFVNLFGYGEALMKQQNCVQTEYGMVSREDGQEPKHTALDDQGPQAGMTM